MPGTRIQFSVALTLLLSTLLHTVSAHFQIVYPGWRGNTLHDDQQWEYPCAGLATTTNRTNWPMSKGRISVIPGWNAGHPTAFFYVNMGYGSEPRNMTNVMIKVFQETGPDADPYPGTFCLTDVPLPVNNTLKAGDNATIQIIQVALHGASLYNCADVTLVEPGEEDPMPEGMCQNSSTIGFNLVYTTSGAETSPRLFSTATVLIATALSGITGWILA